MRGVLLALCAAACSCSFDRIGLTVQDAEVVGGVDRAEPAVDAGVDGAAPSCEAMCLGPSTLRACDPPSEIACNLGCIPEAGNPHCARIVPSNGVSIEWLDGAVATMSIPSGQTVVFDTDTGEIAQCGVGTIRPPGTGVLTGIEFRIAAPGGERGLGTFAMRSIAVAQGATVRPVGENGFALLVEEGVTIDGVIDASGGASACDMDAACGEGTGNRRCGGPGGGDGGGTATAGALTGGGGAGTGGSPGLERGGGGGGFGASGGTGGANGGAAGTSFGGTTGLTGGGGGGGGGEDANGGTAGWGGGGGGAVQITSNLEITVRETGGIPAGIQVGGAGGGYATGSNGGGGGGAGGGVFLEAPTVRIQQARVTANGGGGGGSPGNPAMGSATEGSPGSFSGATASGGTGTNPGGDGGAGASGSPGQPIGVELDGGAGGGGGTGRIALRARTGGIILVTPTISPAPSQGTITVE